MSVSLDDPSILVWPIGNFWSRYNRAQEEDEWSGEPYEMEDPDFGEFELYFRFKPKVIDEKDCCSALRLELAKIPSNYLSYRIAWEAWIENAHGVRSKSTDYHLFSKTYPRYRLPSKLARDDVGLNGWYRFFDARDLRKFVNSTTLYVCFRLPHPIKSIGLLSTPTIQRWQLKSFLAHWESDEFAVEGLDEVKFDLVIAETAPMSYEIDLEVVDFGPNSKIRAQFTFWIKHGSLRMKKMTKNYTFTKCSSWCRLKYSDPNNFAVESIYDVDENRKPTEKIEFVICCEIRPILNFSPIHLVGGHKQLVVDDEDWNVEVKVEDKIFKTTKEFLSLHSPVFRGMFSNDCRENRNGVIVIENAKWEVVDLMLHYMKTKRLEDGKRYALELLLVADCYDVKDLVKRCINTINDNLDENNVVRFSKLSNILTHEPCLKTHTRMFARRYKENQFERIQSSFDLNSSILFSTLRSQVEYATLQYFWTLNEYLWERVKESILACVSLN